MCKSESDLVSILVWSILAVDADSVWSACQLSRPATMVSPAGLFVCRSQRLTPMVTCVSRCLSSRYQERGIPHRRGVLLYGEPGAGKTSIVSGEHHTDHSPSV